MGRLAPLKAYKVSIFIEIRVVPRVIFARPYIFWGRFFIAKTFLISQNHSINVYIYKMKGNEK